MVVQSIPSQTSLSRMRSVDCSDARYADIGLRMCRKIFFIVMNFAFQFGSPIDASGFSGFFGRECFLSDYIVPTVKYDGGDVFQFGMRIFFMVWLGSFISCD